MTKSKGITTILAGMILLAIFVSVIASILFITAPRVWNILYAAICSFVTTLRIPCEAGFSGASSTPLDQAIHCSILRCTDGCGVVGDIVINDEFDDNILTCREFCPEEWRDENGRICGQNARQFPVEISNIGGSTLIQSESFQSSNLDCILNWGEYNLQDSLYNTIATFDRDVRILHVIPNAITSGTRGTCLGTLGRIGVLVETYDEFRLTRGDYYIVTDHYQYPAPTAFLLGIANLLVPPVNNLINIYMVNARPYTLLSAPDFSREGKTMWAGVDIPVSYRVAVDTGDIDQNNQPIREEGKLTLSFETGGNSVIIELNTQPGTRSSFETIGDSQEFFFRSGFLTVELTNIETCTWLDRTFVWINPDICSVDVDLTYSETANEFHPPIGAEPADGDSWTEDFNFLRSQQFFIMRSAFLKPGTPSGAPYQETGNTRQSIQNTDEIEISKNSIEAYGEVTGDPVNYILFDFTQPIDRETNYIDLGEFNRLNFFMKAEWTDFSDPSNPRSLTSPVFDFAVVLRDTNGNLCPSVPKAIRYRSGQNGWSRIEVDLRLREESFPADPATFFRRGNPGCENFNDNLQFVQLDMGDVDEWDSSNIFIDGLYFYQE